MSVCWSLNFADRCDDAIRETLRTRELAPGFHEAGNVLMNLYERTGRYEDAARVAMQQPIYGVRTDGSALVQAYRDGGAEAYLRKRLEYLDENQTTGHSSIHYGYASVYARLGETDKALDHLEALVDSRSSVAVFIGVDPCIRPLRTHPRMVALLTRLGLPTASTPHTVST